MEDHSDGGESRLHRLSALDLSTPVPMVASGRTYPGSGARLQPEHHREMLKELKRRDAKSHASASGLKWATQYDSDRAQTRTSSKRRVMPTTEPARALTGRGSAESTATQAMSAKARIHTSRNYDKFTQPQESPRYMLERLCALEREIHESPSSSERSRAQQHVIEEDPSSPFQPQLGS